jgi:hypothetical protein
MRAGLNCDSSIKSYLDGNLSGKVALLVSPSPMTAGFMSDTTVPSPDFMHVFTSS